MMFFRLSCLAKWKAWWTVQAFWVCLYPLGCLCQSTPEFKLLGASFFFGGKNPGCWEVSENVLEDGSCLIGNQGWRTISCHLFGSNASPFFARVAFYTQRGRCSPSASLKYNSHITRWRPNCKKLESILDLGTWEMRLVGWDEWEGGKSKGSHNGIINGEFRREAWESEWWFLKHPIDDKKGHDFGLKYKIKHFFASFSHVIFTRLFLKT